MRYFFCAFGALIVALSTAEPTLAQSTSGQLPFTRKPQPTLTAEQLETFIKTHKGPVLDVRDAADCDPNMALPITTHRVTFDLSPQDHASFVADLRRHRTFVQVQRNQTPVLVVCCGGVRSQAAADVLARHGFNVVTLDGGVVKALAPAQTASR